MDKNGRQLRIHKPNTIHHVMIRGNNGQPIFFGNDYFQYFLAILEASSKKFDHKILSYCLMSNHVHLIVHIHDSPLSSLMQYINFRYARWLNHKQKRIGHLFQGRYRSLEVRNEAYLVNLFRYVHFNPIAAKMVTCLDYYAWSSHFYYLQGDAPSWMEINFILDLIRSKRNLNYDMFINNALESKDWKPLMRILESGKIEYNKDAVQELQAEGMRELTENTVKLTPHDVLEKVCHQLNADKMALLGTSRNRSIAKQRIFFANCLLKYTEMNITDVAEFLQRTRSTLRRQLREMDAHSERYFPKSTLAAIDNAFMK